MAQLVPENTTRRIDGIGRITLPKGLRDRMEFKENDQIELYTAYIDGRRCVVLTAPIAEEDELEYAKEILAKHGIEVNQEA